MMPAWFYAAAMVLSAGLILWSKSRPEALFWACCMCLQFGALLKAAGL